MDIKRNPYLLLAAAVLLSVAVVWVFAIGQPKTTTVVDPNTGEEVQVGALTGPDIPSPYLQWGGVTTYAGSMTLKSAASTTCAIQTPSSTSTLVSATVRLDGTAPYATTFELGAGATAFTTTTRLALMSFGTSEKGSIIATTTINAPTTLIDTLLAPNTWVNLKVATGSVSALFAPQGECKAVFRVI